jgi:hypothetical protein
MRELLVFVGFALGAGGVVLVAVGVLSATATVLSWLVSAVVGARREHQRLAR